VKQDSVDLHKAALLAPGAAACSDRALESGKGARERPRTLHTELEIRKSRLRRLTLERELRVAPTFHVLLRLVSREDHIEPTPSNQQIRAVRGRTIAARSATSRGWVCNASSASSSSSHACSGITVTKQWPEPFNDPRLSLIVDSFFSEAQNGPNLHPGTERVDCARCCFVCLQQHLKHSSSWCRQSLAEHLKASQKQETQLIVQSRDPRVREADVRDIPCKLGTPSASSSAENRATSCLFCPKKAGPAATCSASSSASKGGDCSPDGADPPGGFLSFTGSLVSSRRFSDMRPPGLSWCASPRAPVLATASGRLRDIVRMAPEARDEGREAV